ncbi:MAG: hypothetical protein K1X82_10580 [Bacteroidia bacterium]|nr:hypothetical protein [Bacteroidia bacterium]
MKRILLSLLMLSGIGKAQTLPFDFTYNWSGAGLVDSIVYDTISATDFGFVGDSATINDAAWSALLPQLGSAPTVVFFPAGNYLFQSQLSLPNQTVIAGEGSAETKFHFSISQAVDLMRINGNIEPTKRYLTATSVKGDRVLELNPGTLAAGDWIYVDDVDTALAFSSWSDGYCGQLARIVNVWSDSLEINRALRRDYAVSQAAFVQKMLPKINCGISCITIRNAIATNVAARSNIGINYAFNSFVRGVESINCDFGHISTERSGSGEISGCYFHHATVYGDGGQGYGVNMQLGASDWLVKNNNFNHCRHAMLLQSGSNGNVFYHNYSTDPYWTQFPTTSAGDLVLHGNYPYMNLFEENVIQNLTIDASHGKNGPFNIFLRNRVQLYGVITNNSPATDSSAFIGNEITSTAQFTGNFLVNGLGNQSFGNNQHGTTIPAGTGGIDLVSLYQPTQTDPIIGYPNPISSQTIEAVTNRTLGVYTVCVDSVDIPTNTAMPEKYTFWVNNPVQEELLIQSEQGMETIRLYSLPGTLLLEVNANLAKEWRISCNSFSKGIYLVEVQSGQNRLIRKVCME